MLAKLNGKIEQGREGIRRVYSRLAKQSNADPTPFLHSLSFDMGKDALQKRLEMPMGVKPAARVKRRGKPIAVPGNMEDTDAIADPMDSKNAVRDQLVEPREGGSTASEPDSMSAVLGSVVERRRKGRSKKKKMLTNGTIPRSNGFPALRVAPVGTLVRPRIQHQQRASPERKEIMLQEEYTPVNSSATNNTTEQMLKESQSEAAAMLNDMSDTEIHQQAQELRSSLNPNLVAFLEQRGKSKGAVKSEKVVSFVEPITDEPKPSALAETLSSIRTYQDLDTAYETYIKEHGRETSSHVVSDEKDDFLLACDLLRSTSPHQTLWAARCVAQELSKRQDIPLLLPISLRCLLDSSITTEKSALQATYVLQALYTLVCKCACSDHVVDVTGNSMDAAAIYQLYFLDDAVPTARIRSCYEAVTLQSIATNELGAAYTTQSSALSAQSDAKAFQKDPMWTLLSRTRILPRLATIARLSTCLPVEAWVSVCGILAMLGQRSPGAATAILDHATLLPCLESRLMFGSGEYHPSRSLPMVILYCTLSRQSRHAATRIAEQATDKIVEIMSLGGVGDEWRLLHRWTLILWRILLRYGYGATIAQSMLTISTPILTLGPNAKDTLEIATGFYSCFTVLLKYASTCCLYSESKSPEEAATSASSDTLKQASLWLTSESSWRQSLGHFQSIRDVSSPSVCSFYASVLLFLKASLRHVIETIGRKVISNTDTEIAGRIKDLAQVLGGFIGHPSIANSFQLATENAIFPVTRSDADADKREAASAALFTSLSGFIEYLSRQSDFMSSSGTYLESMTSWTKAPKTDFPSQRKLSLQTETLDKSRIRWLNLSLVAILLSDMSITLSTRKAGAKILIGRLLCGEEALFAAILNGGVLNGGRTTLTTALATLLCASKSGRSQLLHSRMILDRFVEIDIVSSETAPLDIKSLLSESTDATPDDLLPLGGHWLWQLASGSFNSGRSEHSIAERENGEVMSDALGAILRGENDDYGSIIPYTHTLTLGPKVFWMICVFLHGNTRDFSIASNVLKLYMHRWTNDECATFIGTCLKHHVQQPTKAADTEDSIDPDPAARQIVESNIPEASVRALEALVNDVCDKVLLDGPECSLGVLCLRVFLANSFSPKIRCLVLQKLRETIHLLTHDDLLDIDSLWLEYCVAPGIDYQATREPPEIIDCVVDLYAHGRVVRPDDCFVNDWAVLLLARNVILHIKTGNQASLRVMYRRLQLVHRAVATRVFVAVSNYLENANAPMDTLIAIITAMERTSVENNAEDDPWPKLASAAKHYRPHTHDEA